MFDNLRKDIFFSFRQLHRNLCFTATAIVVLALGICASLAIFAFVDAALIQPLPYRDPARLLGVFESKPTCPQCNLSYPDYLDWKKLNTVFSSFDIYNRNGFTLAAPSGAEPVRGARVTDGFFRTLGVTPVLGRDFYPGEDLPSAGRAALITNATWRKRFGGSRDVLGRVVILDDNPTTIIGVLPPGFHFAPAEPAEFWITLHATHGCDIRRSCHSMYGVGRLRDDPSIRSAQSNVSAIAKTLEQQYPASNLGQGALVVPLSEVIVGNIRPILMVLLGGAGLLLLIAGVNVAGLLLVRSESRRREIAVRTALGASSARLIAQFVTEALVLVCAGAALGLTAAHWTIQLLLKLIPQTMMNAMPFLHGIGLNARALALGAAISIVAAILLGAPPTLRLWSSGMRDGLAEASRGSAGTVWRRVGSRLVVLELATAMVLLVGAGLLGQSLYRLLNVNLGVQPEHLATIYVNAPDAYRPDDKAIALARQVIAGVENLPGVKSVGISGLGIPLAGNGNTTWFHVLGRPWHGEHNDTPYRNVSPDYFTALGAKLARGRYFRETDAPKTPKVAIVNQAFVRKYFTNEDALGKQLLENDPKAVPIDIVGVVEDIREGPLDAPIPPVLYVPFQQNTDNYFNLVARTGQGEQALLPAIADLVRRIDPAIVTTAPMTMVDRINTSQSATIHRSAAWLVGGFAALALLLGVVGLYGVIAYSVGQRSREIGIRMALGAQPAAVYRLILSEAASLMAFGVALGIVSSIAAASLIGKLLFGVRSWDVPTLAAVSIVLSIAALLASLLPARRAAQVNPTEALRQ